MTAEQLRNSILQEAISGRLVPQDPNDEPAEIVSTVPEDEVPFEIPSTWRWVFLKDCAAIIGGYAFPSASIKGEKGVRVIRISDINEKGFVNKSVVRYNGHENLDKFKIIPQDILIAMTGGTVGKSLFVMQIEEDMLLNQRVAIIRNNGQYAPYLDIVVKSPQIKSFINDKKNSTNDNISMGDINNFLVPLPPLAEQKRIVAKLEELLPIVDQYGKAQKELDELNTTLPARLRQSILLEAISGKLIPQDENDEPARVLLARLDAEKKTLVANKILKKTELDAFELEEQPDTIPTGWQFVKLRKICTLLDGEKKNGKYICMDAKFLRGKSQGIYMEQGKFVHKGDNVILVDGENSGEVFVAPIDGYMGSTFKQLWISKEMYIPYVIYLIKSFKETLRNDKKGAAIPHLKKELFFNLPVGIPPLTEQQRIVAKIEELFEQIDKITK